MKEVLEKLKLRGIQVAIISSRTKQAPKEDLFSIMYYLKSNNVDPNVFFFIQGREDCEQVKPNPQVFFPITGILENQDISWKEVIYVGDTINYDLESTKRHHPQISFVGMDCGAADKVDFMKAGISKECIINSPEQIFRAIDFYEKN